MTGTLYENKTLSGTYVEIAYQSNDGTYYINHKALVDLVLLVFFVGFFVFTFISLSIKFFSLGKK